MTRDLVENNFRLENLQIQYVFCCNCNKREGSNNNSK